MKLNIGIVGPKILVQDICSVVEEFPEVELIPLIYRFEQEASAVIAQSDKLIDIYMFSGPVPYFLSKQSLPPEKKAIFIPFEGTDIYSILLKIYRVYQFFPIISFDIINPGHLHEVYEEQGITQIPWFIKNMEGYWDSEELFNHHLQLWKERKIQVIATCLHSVYERFQQMKIPVFLTKHTKQTIRETAQRAILIGLEQKKSESQITVLQFEINRSDTVGDYSRESHEQKEIEERILEYGNKLFSGSGVIEDNTITLYTTRGVLERVTNYGKDFTIIHDIHRDYSCKVGLGIGMGDSGESAAYNARKALQFAIQNGRDCGFLIDDEKRVHGPLGTGQSLEYPLHTEEGSYVPLTLRKFYAWLSMMKKNRVTARDISIGMNTSNRHATRILKTLCDKGLAEVVGRESMNQKGRPRPIYKIDLVKLAGEVQERSHS